MVWEGGREGGMEKGTLTVCSCTNLLQLPGKVYTVCPRTLSVTVATGQEAHGDAEWLQLPEICVHVT